VEVDPVSTFPTTKELLAGVKEVTEAAVEPVEEPPVDCWRPTGVYPEISYIETEPAAVEPKDAVIVSPPELFAVAYQM
jgi:hypothetical protein